MGWIPYIERVDDLAPPFGVFVETRKYIGEALYSILSNDAEVAALISTRIYPNLLPESATLPALTYQELTALRQYVLTGPVGMVRFRFQINCWASTYASADELSIEVRKALDGYSGMVENQYIHFIELLDEGDMLENIAGLDVIKKYGKRLDLYIWSNELTD